MNPNFPIENKTALVTGANRGIGKSIVEAFLRAGAAKVYAGVRRLDSAAALVAEHGDKVVPVRVDLDEPDTITAAAETASDAQVVVNNAGVLRVSGPLADDAIASLQFEMEVNVFGLMRMARAFAPVLKANGGGAFVQLNSIASLKSFPDFATYCASKAAAYSMTQALRAEMGQAGTAVLSVHPGPIATDMADAAGFMETADPPSMVADGVVEALRNGDFHLFPDTMARQIWDAYQSFAENVVDADMTAEE